MASQNRDSICFWVWFLQVEINRYIAQGRYADVWYDKKDSISRNNENRDIFFFFLDLLIKKFQQAYNALPDAYPCRGLDLVASSFSVAESSSRSLTQFFTKAPSRPVGELSSSPKKEASSSKIEEDTWECDKCQERVHIRDIDEHTDYHFALEISQQDNTTPKRKSSLQMAPFFIKKQK